MNVKVFALSLLNCIFLFSTLVNAIDLPADVIIIDGRRYVIKKPIRYTSRDQSKNFKKDPFYLDFMNRVMDSSEVLKGKSANPLSEIDRCISENINKKRSLQLSAIQCFSAEVDPEYKGYGIWQREGGAEELSMPKSPAAFLEGYLTGINLPQQTKENTKLPTCRDNPNHPDLNCVKFECGYYNNGTQIEKYSRTMSYPVWCAQTYCPEGKAFLIETIRSLEYLYNKEDPRINSLLDQNLLGLNRNKIKQIMSPTEEYDARKACFQCPAGSKRGDHGDECLDRDGCNIVLEEFSSVHKKCISKYQNYDFRCSNYYKDKIFEIVAMRDEDSVKENFKLRYGRGAITAQSISESKRVEFIAEFIVKSSQAIARYEDREKKCKDGDEYIDDFKNDFIELEKKFSCQRNKEGKCDSSACAGCKFNYYSYEDLLQTTDLPKLRVACGYRSMRSVLLGFFNIKYGLLFDVLRECNSQSFQCPDFSLTEQEVIDYAIRAGFECARRAAVMPSTKINRGQR